MKNWSSNEVCNWLRSLGMEEYQQNFHDNRIDGSVLCIADHQMLKELNVESTDRIKILKAIQGINDGSLGQDVDSLVQIVSRNDRIIDDLQHQIESVKKDLAVYRMAMQPKLAVKTGEDRKIPQRTLSSPENADKAIKIIPLGQEEIRAQITEKDLCKAVIADTLAKLKITCDWKDYVMLLHISKKKSIYISPYELLWSFCKRHSSDVIPSITLQHAKLIPLPNTQPLSMDPGTFYAATLGYGSGADGTGVYPYEAQSIKEFNVIVGERYSIIARDGEWCVIEKNGYRGSVPSLCIAEYDDSLQNVTGTCIYEYHRRSGKELSLKRGSQLVILEMYQHWCKVQDGDNEGLVPLNYIISSTCSHYNEIVKLYIPGGSNTIHERFKQGFQFLDFWESNIGKGTNTESSVKKLATNTRKLVRNLFSKDSEYAQVLFDGPLSDKIEEKIKEFYEINTAKQAQFDSLQSRTEKYDLVRSVIRKNYALLMKLANILLQDPNIGSMFDLNK